MFSACTSAWLGGLGGRFALEHWHAGFCIATAHQPPLLIRRTGLGVQLAAGVGLDLKVCLGAVQPGRTLVGAERIGQTREAQGEVTPSPLASRAVVAAHLAADVQVGRPVAISGS
jgi:hypothetical protein